jgi:hypothetical protein
LANKIPYSSGEASKRFLRGPAGPSVEEAKAEMIAAAEPATSTRLGAKVPAHIEQARAQSGMPAQETPTPQPARQNVKPKSTRMADTLRNRALNKIRHLGLPTGMKVNLVEMVRAGKLSREEAEELAERPLNFDDSSVAALEAPEPDAIAEPNAAETDAQPERVEAAEQRECVEAPDGSWVGEVYRDGNNWVSEIKYRDGGGTERFVAPTQRQLLVKMTQAHAHGTLRVKAAVRREKYGLVPESQEEFMTKLYKENGITKTDFDGLPSPASRQAMINNMVVVEMRQFLDEHSDYFVCPNNHQRLTSYCSQKGQFATARNLEIALRELTAEGFIETKPTVAPPAPAPARPPAAATSVSVEPAPEVARVATPTMPVRKRGQSSTGIIPGASSVVSDAGENTQRTATPTSVDELSAEDAKKIPLETLRDLMKLKTGRQGSLGRNR